jgi:hypothetical protein
MGKILMDIILHSNGDSDEEITTLFNREDWKEWKGFSVRDNGDIGWRGNHWWVSNPQNIFRKKTALALKSEKLSKQNQEYEEKIKELEVKQEEFEIRVEELEERVEIEVEMNLKALDKSKEW